MSSDTLSKIGINDFVKLSIFKGCGFESWISEDQIRRSKLLFFFNFFSEDQNILHLLSEDRKSSFSEDQKQIFFFYLLTEKHKLQSCDQSWKKFISSEKHDSRPSEILPNNHFPFKGQNIKNDK